MCKCTNFICVLVTISCGLATILGYIRTNLTCKRPNLTYKWSNLSYKWSNSVCNWTSLVWQTRVGTDHLFWMSGRVGNPKKNFLNVGSGWWFGRSKFFSSNFFEKNHRSYQNKLKKWNLAKMFLFYLSLEGILTHSLGDFLLSIFAKWNFSKCLDIQWIYGELNKLQHLFWCKKVPTANH